MSVSGSWRRTARGAMLLGADDEVRPTIFAEMSALAAATGAINLGQGFPDEDGPPEVLEAARQSISDGVNQYPPGLGSPLLRTAIAEHHARFYNLSIDPDREVLVTAGATEALAATILALTEPGDEVITLEPFYDAYAAVIALSGSRHITVGLRAPLFQPDLDELRAAFSPKTRLIVLNSPHNPTGSILSSEAMAVIVEAAEKFDVTIVTDEVYEHLVFDGRHVPIATLPGARDRTVSISSGGKTFSTTGWKIGWLTAPPHLVQAILAVKQYLTFVNGAPFQPAIATGLRLPASFFESTAATLRAKRDLLAQGLIAAGFTVTSPQAGYFILADAAALDFATGEDLCRTLPTRAGVAAVPVSAFVTPEHRAPFATLVRFAFCKKTEVLVEAAQRLAALRTR